MIFPLVEMDTSFFIVVSSLLCFTSTIECYKTEGKIASVQVDPDFYRNVSQLISSKGYPVEEYNVKTTDGYILGVQRIPYGKLSAHPRTKIRPVVFLQHGLLGCAADWLLNLANESLGFILADAGYDVWLGNQRGTTYSRRHVNYSADDSEFWKFSFDEMAKYDLPAMIEFALSISKQKQLYYIGHSQGTTALFAFLSERPNYKQIRAVMALGPVATVGFISSPVRYLAPFVNEIDFILKLFGIGEFLPNSAIIRFLGRLVCRRWMDVVCENIFFLIGGFDPAQLNATRIPVYAGHDPAGTSTQNIVHFAQMVNSRKFVKYDFGHKKNLKKYGQATPPEYKIENIQTPIALFSGLNDILADPVDVALLKPRIKNLVESYIVKDPLWEHIDFILGMDAPRNVYKELLRVLLTV